MVTDTQDKFNVFIPIEIIEKGKKDENGLPEELIISGVASASPKDGRKDLDGEWLDVNGYDYQPFLKSGFFNLEHKGREDYANIIGEPTNAFVKNGQFHVEGKLYKDNPKAVSVWQLGQILKKAGSSRKIGYSIEGKAVARDPFDEKKITKARITGCAVTISPKNDGTELIFKGETDYELQPGSEFLIDITDENGVRWTVDQNLDIQKAMTVDNSSAGEFVEDKNKKQEYILDKAMTAGETTGRDTTDKLLTQEPLKEESVEEKKKKKKKTEFSKSEIYNEIFSIFKTDVNETKRIYNIIRKIQDQLTPNMTTEKVTAEAIQKAEEILGLRKAAEPTAEEIAAKKKADDDLKKAADDLKKSEEATTLKAAWDDLMKKAEDLKKQAAEVGVNLSNPMGDANGGAVSGQAVPNVGKAEAVDIQKAEEKVQALGLLLKAQGEENQELKKSIESISDFNARLAERLGMIEKQPLDRKSITIAKYLEKGGEAAATAKAADGSRTLSLSNAVHRAQLADVLFNAATSGATIDSDFEKACKYVEMTKSFGGDANFAKRIADRLKNEHKVIVVK